MSILEGGVYIRKMMPVVKIALQSCVCRVVSVLSYEIIRNVFQNIHSVYVLNSTVITFLCVQMKNVLTN